MGLWRRENMPTVNEFSFNIFYPYLVSSGVSPSVFPLQDRSTIKRVKTKITHLLWGNTDDAREVTNYRRRRATNGKNNRLHYSVYFSRSYYIYLYTHTHIYVYLIYKINHGICIINVLATV